MTTEPQPIKSILPKVLTAMQEPSTKGEPQPTVYKRLRRLSRYETLNDPQLEKFLHEAATFAASLNYTRPYWLTLASPSGSGKTMLARAVYRQFMEQNRFEVALDVAAQKIVGNTGMFVDWRKFCDSVRGGCYELIEDLCDEWFVIIDDLGSERDTSGFIASAVDRIMNSRRGKWTLITTNLSLAEIGERVDVRVASRLVRDDNKVIEINVPDWNQREC